MMKLFDPQGLRFGYADGLHTKRRTKTSTCQLPCTHHITTLAHREQPSMNARHTAPCATCQLVSCNRSDRHHSLRIHTYELSQERMCHCNHADLWQIRVPYQACSTCCPSSSNNSTSPTMTQAQAEPFLMQCVSTNRLLHACAWPQFMERGALRVCVGSGPVDSTQCLHEGLNLQRRL